jgi:hypothetical protein
VKTRISYFAVLAICGILFLLLHRWPNQPRAAVQPVSVKKHIEPEDERLSDLFTQGPKFEISLALKADGPLPGTSEKNTVGGWWAIPFSDPEEARVHIRTVNGKTIDAMYERFYELVGFTPEQRIRFKDIRLDRGEAISRLLKASAKGTSIIADGTVGLTLDVIKDQVGIDYENALLAEFGTETVQVLKRYDSERIAGYKSLEATTKEPNQSVQPMPGSVTPRAP